MDPSEKRIRLLQKISPLLISISGFFLLVSLMTRPAEAAPALDSAIQTATVFSMTSPATILMPLTPTPTIAPSPTFDLSRLDRPSVSNPTSQLDEGALVFWGICISCHGDRGQGLTDEWRESFGEDRDCWTSKCHDLNHPPQGFEFPNLVPSLSGEGRLLRFVNAGQLFEYNFKMMPWWKPGSLTRDKAWAVTAYLLQLNGRLPEDTILGASNARFIPIKYSTEPPAREQPWKILLAGVLLLAGLGVGGQSMPTRGKLRPGFILHLHPPNIPALQARFRHTLGAGGLALFFCLILLFTGLLEMYYYIPSPEHAARSVQEISFLVPFGGLVRNLHFWSAQALAIVVTLHLARVIFTGAYNRPRRFNYLLGLGLFVIVLLLDFTGYVLRWDEGIRWALIAGTNLLGSVPVVGEGLVRLVSGSPEPGPAMLIRYYAWHIFGLVLIGTAGIVWHLFRVRRDGGIAAPPPPLRANPTCIPRAELLRREAVVMLVAGGMLLLFSTFLQAPIAPGMDTSLVSLTESRAPWFFLWVQELLKLGDPFLWGIAIPISVMLILALLPYISPRLSESEIGSWFPRSGRAAQWILMILVVLLTILTILATH